jgi:D-serine deaminase-like pyridoxal phosphate-dependent protein
LRLAAHLERARPVRPIGVANCFGLGDKIRLIPGHCDPTVNLYDWYVCVRGNRVEQI